MTTREKISSYIGSLPPFATTHAELAKRIGASYAGVAVAVPLLLAAGKLRILAKDGRRTIYEVVDPGRVPGDRPEEWEDGRVETKVDLSDAWPRKGVGR